jgi:DNA repair exonuclease SbcCD ATPase subunit
MQRNAQLSKPVCFYFSNPSVYGGTGEIIQGMPEQYAAPAGFEKIVCRTVQDAERWSARMRVWEKAKEEIAEAYQRAKEAEWVRGQRSEMQNKIANARNQVNRDFMIQALANFDKRYEDRFKTERVSYLHSEAFSADDKSVATPKVRLPKKLAQSGVLEHG